MADLWEEFSPVCSKPKPKMPTRTEFLSSYYKNQSFPLPNSIIYYITKNPPNSKMYQKMVQCCKYFFMKNPILVIDCLHLHAEKQWLFQLFDSNNVSKIWITHNLVLFTKLDQLSSVFSKIYKCDFKALSISNNSLTFNEFLFISSSAKFIDLKNVTIKYSNGNDVELEKLVEVCPTVKQFQYTFSSNPSNISFQTVKNLIKIPHFSTMKRFCFSNIPDIFDIKTLIEFLKKTDLRVNLKFSNSLSNAYHHLLNHIIVEILMKDFYIYGPPPFIRIPGLDNEIQIELYRKASGEY